MKDTCLEWESESKTPCRVFGYPLFVMQRSVIRAICLAQNLPTLNTFTEGPQMDDQLRLIPRQSTDEKKRSGLKRHFPGCLLNGFRKQAKTLKPFFTKDKKNQPSWQLFSRIEAYCPSYAHSFSVSESFFHFTRTVCIFCNNGRNPSVAVCIK